MSFYRDLGAGTYGVRFPTHPSWQVLSEGQHGFAALDPKRRGIWQAAFIPVGFDLDPAHDELLERTLHREANARFEEAFAEHLAERGPATSPLDYDQPRTAQGDGWTALVEWDRKEVSGGQVLTLIHRTLYVPGSELVRARILIPTILGVVDLCFAVAANQTGYRESALHMLAQRDGVEASRAFYDDRRWDPDFPDHPLSHARRVLRGALRELTILDGPRPFEPLVELPEAESVVELPPRFRVVPPGYLPLAPALASLMRISLSVETHALAEVFKLNGRLDPRDRDGLEALAIHMAESWKNEGVLSVKHKTARCEDRKGRLELAMRINFRDSFSKKHTAQFWTIDHDGTPFRVAASGPRTVPFDELVAIAEQLASSWRRLPAR